MPSLAVPRQRLSMHFYSFVARRGYAPSPRRLVPPSNACARRLSAELLRCRTSPLLADAPHSITMLCHSAATPCLSHSLRRRTFPWRHSAMRYIALPMQRSTIPVPFVTKHCQLRSRPLGDMRTFAPAGLFGSLPFRCHELRLPSAPFRPLPCPRRAFVRHAAT